MHITAYQKLFVLCSWYKSPDIWCLQSGKEFLHPTLEIAYGATKIGDKSIFASIQKDNFFDIDAHFDFHFCTHHPVFMSNSLWDSG